MSELDRFRLALELIVGDSEDGCSSFTGRLSTCDTTGGRSPYAKFGADRWCDRCVARTVLAGGELPAWGVSGVEELPLNELPGGVTAMSGRFWWLHHRQFGDRSRVCGPTPGTSGHPTGDCVGCGVRELDWFRGEPIAKCAEAVATR
jgi:hypothetical protein